MVGPLLFAIVEAALEKGFRAGLAVAGGVWVSDFLYVLLVYKAVWMISALTSLPGFNFWAGLAGGAILVAFGIGSLVRSQKAAAGIPIADKLLDAIDGPEQPGVEHNWSKWGYFGYWLRGFLLNTINPFTVFFWLGIGSAVVAPNQWNDREVIVFFSGMLGVLLLTDTLKAYAAKRVRNFLTPGHSLWVRRIIGAVLIVSGIVVVIRVV